jgi:hypothetical protein
MEHVMFICAVSDLYTNVSLDTHVLYRIHESNIIEIEPLK